MKYLFFDIECAKHDDEGAAICSFGYVLTDGSFNVLEQEDILINPASTFQWYVVKNILAYPKKVFYESPKFDKFYGRIKELITTADVVVGHSVDNDADYILDELRRYRLPYFDYTFYDSQLLFNGATGHEGQISLSKMFLELELGEPENVHRSDEDARATMIAVKRICELKQTTLDELVKITPYCSGKVVGDKIILDRPKLPSIFTIGSFDIAINKINSRNGEIFRYFYSTVRPSSECEKTLRGKTVTVSAAYRKTHFKEMLVLIQAIADRGGRYREFVSHSDVFVSCVDGDEESNEARRAQRTVPHAKFLTSVGLDPDTIFDSPVPYLDPSVTIKDIRRQSKEHAATRKK